MPAEANPLPAFGASRTASLLIWHALVWLVLCLFGHGIATAQTSVIYYGSPTGTALYNAGSKCLSGSDPCSLAQVQKAYNTLSGTQKGGQITTVELLGGTYYLPPPTGTSTGGTLQFAASDSGTAVSGAGSVTWTNAPGQTAIISGGLPATSIPGFGGWSCSNGVCAASLPSAVPEFENLFYFNGDTTSTSDGRRLRSRAYSSNGAPGTSAAVGYYWKSGACYSTYSNQQVNDPALCNLGTFLRVKNTIAPSDSFGTGCTYSTDSSTPPNYKCLDRFYYDPNDAGAIFAWSNLHATSTCPSQSSTGASYPAGDVTLTLFDAWAVERMRVSCVDTADHIVYFAGPTGSGGGGTNYSFFGPAVGHRFIVENTLDAFNDDKNNALSGRTGVWFRDRYANTLSYIPKPFECPVVGFNGCGRADLPGVVVPLTAPNMSSTFPRGSLVYASSLTNVTFQRSVDGSGNGDLIFEVDNFVIASAGLNYDENEEAKLPQAIDCESCVNVTFNGITVRHTSASGILFASSSQKNGTPGHNDTLENSAFYDIGDSGIRIGHASATSDTASAAVNNITVTNNIVQGFSRVYADGEGIGQGNGNTIAYLNNDIRDGYHAGISVCNAGCAQGAHVADGSHTLSQYNHISNTMQGVTSDGGTLYYGTGFWDGYGVGNQIFNNLVHDTTDSSIIDSTACPGQSHCPGTGYGGQGIYLDNETGGVDVESNVLFRISQNALWMSRGPALGTPGNTYNNNIAAFALESLFQESNPWSSQNSNFGYPNGCYPRSSDGPMATFSNNIFYFDRNLTYQPLSAPQGFSLIQGCAYTCSDQGSGLTSYNQFHSFQGNLYWRTDGTLPTDAKNVFHVQTRAPSPATGCYGSTNPANNWTFFPFSAASGNNWQMISAVTGLTNWSLTGGMNEDLSGTASADPGLGNGFGTNQGQRNYWTGDKTDFLLSGVPNGWQSSFNWGGLGTGNCAFATGTPDGTNCTILYAGRNGVTPNTPAVVPATYPTYSYTYIQTHPMGIQITDNGASLGVSPVTTYLEKGTPHTLSVPASVTLGGVTYYFSNWEDGSQSTTHAKFTVNTVDTAPKPYFATYVGTTTTSAGGATATYGDASVNLTATVKFNGSVVTEGTVTFLVYHGTSTSGSSTNGSVNGNGVATVSYALSGAGVTTSGSWTILATFGGTENYRSSSGAATLTVNQATPGLSWTPQIATLSNGIPLDGSQLNAAATVAGSFSYVDSSNGNVAVTIGTVLASGPHVLVGTFTPSDTTDYVTGGTVGATITITTTGPHALQFYPVTPCRIADTRAFAGMTGAFGPPSMDAQSTRSFPVLSSSCNIPSTASAYSLNITAVPTGSTMRWLTTWPTGETEPVASTLNSYDGVVTANAALVPAGTDGAISIFVSDATDVVIDIDGYFAPPASGGLDFYPATPCRVADTRALGGMTGAFGPPSMAAQSTRDFPVPQSSCSVPTTAAAYSLNMTVVPTGSTMRWLTTWPTGQTEPIASTLNSYNGAVTANAALVPAGTNGSISIFVSDATDVLFDINGYFAPPSSGLHFYPVTPCRVADTRALGGFSGAFGPPSMAAQSTRSFPVAGSCGIPSTAVAYSLNMTAVPSTDYLDYLTTWATGQPTPVASTLNSWDGQVKANAAIVPAGTNGAISIYVSDATDVLFDVNGYFAP